MESQLLKMTWVCTILLVYSIFISFKYLSCDTNINKNENVVVATLPHSEEPPVSVFVDKDGQR